MCNLFSAPASKLGFSWDPPLRILRLDDNDDGDGGEDDAGKQ